MTKDNMMGKSTLRLTSRHFIKEKLIGDLICIPILKTLFNLQIV